MNFGIKLSTAIGKNQKVTWRKLELTMAEKLNNAWSEFLFSLIELKFDQATEAILSEQRLTKLFCEEFSVVGPVTEVTVGAVKALTHEQAGLFTAKAFSYLCYEPEWKFQTLCKAMALGLSDGGVLAFIENMTSCFSEHKALDHFMAAFSQTEELLTKVVSLLAESTIDKCLIVDVLRFSTVLDYVKDWQHTELYRLIKTQCEPSHQNDVHAQLKTTLVFLSDHLFEFYMIPRKPTSVKCKVCHKRINRHSMKINIYLELSKFLTNISNEVMNEATPHKLFCVKHIIKSVVSVKFENATNSDASSAYKLLKAVVNTPHLDDELCIVIVEQLNNTYRHLPEFHVTSDDFLITVAGSIRSGLLKFLRTLDDKPSLSASDHLSHKRGPTPLMSVVSRGQISKSHIMSLWSSNERLMEKLFLDTLQLVLDMPHTDVNALNSKGSSALSYLLQQDIRVDVKIQACEMLFQHNVKLCNRDYQLIMAQSVKVTGRGTETFNDRILTLLLDYPHFDVNYHQPGSGKTLLMAAACTNSELLKFLLERPKVDINATCAKGQTCFSYTYQWKDNKHPWERETILSECIKSFEILLENKEINPNHIDKAKQTPLQHCMNMEHMETRRQYLKRLLVHPKLQNLNFQDKRGDTPLHIMIDCGEYCVVQKVLQTKEQSSDEPIRFDIQNNHSKDIIDRLLSSAGDVVEEEISYLDNLKLITKQPNISINYRFARRRTLLTKACVHGCDQAVDFLLDQEGIDLNTQDDLGYTPLMYGITKLQHTTILKFLLIPAYDLKLKNNKGETLQQVAERQEEVFSSIKDVINIAMVRSSVVPSISSLPVEDHVKLLLNAVNKDSRFTPDMKKHLKHEVQCLESDMSAFSAGRYGHELSMSKEHRDKLRCCRVYICNELMPYPIFKHLVQDGVLTDDIVEDIKQVQTRSRISEKLLSILPLRGPKAYDSFLTALKDEEQGHIAAMIEEYDPTKQEGTSTQLMPFQGTNQADWVPVMVPRNVFVAPAAAFSCEPY